jgi:hypothetical protein
MATNKQIIFGTENKTALAPAPPVAVEQQQQLQPQQVIVQQKQKQKSVAKSSNLGVKLTMKKITKSPVPDILPGLQPNQPVQVKGALNIAQPVIPDVKAPQPAEFNPAVKHPATAGIIATNTTNMQTKKSAFKPETTHPASLPQQQQIIPIAEKLKLGNFRERLVKKNQKSKKTNKKTRKTHKGKYGKHSKTSKKEPSKKQSTRMIFS